jgi:hypothetical protein
MARSPLPVVCVALLAFTSPPLRFEAARARVEATDLVNHPFSADFAPGGKLRLRVRSGDIRVVGTGEDKISVELSGRKAADAGDLEVRLNRDGSAADLRIWGGPRNDLTITIRIPARTDLYARIPFGQVEVDHVAGDQDIALHAGELVLSVGEPSEYSRVDASVICGELDAEAFGEEHGGLFRSFHKEGSGKYRLYAHVGAGELILR